MLLFFLTKKKNNVNNNVRRVLILFTGCQNHPRKIKFAVEFGNETKLKRSLRNDKERFESVYERIFIFCFDFTALKTKERGRKVLSFSAVNSSESILYKIKSEQRVALMFLCAGVSTSPPFFAALSFYLASSSGKYVCKRKFRLDRRKSLQFESFEQKMQFVSLYYRLKS